MKCPRCDHDTNDQQQCPNCGFDIPASPWVVIATVNPPEDALLESLIKSFGIPVKLIKSLGSVFGLAVGPLGEVKVAVPEAYAEQTQALLQAEMEGKEDS
ncbi:MAG: hypothetical protein ABRQ24_05365 [Syntrophomonadaceae bacterium]